MNYFICGFSGAGKSTILKEIASHSEVKLNCIDLDDHIFLNHGHGYEKLGDFIEAVGLDHFRALEFSTLMSLNMNDNQLVSLGGGALNEQTIGILSGWSGFWLNTDFDTCWERISQDESRPLARLGKEGMRELYSQRLIMFKGYPKLVSILQLIEISKDS